LKARGGLGNFLLIIVPQAFKRCLLVAGLLAGTGCKAKIPVITEPFADPFERAEVGPDWLDTGRVYKVSAGKLNVAGAYNHPLWLRRKLPRDVVIELDVMSKSPSGDIKIELFGDGESFDPDKNRYDPTGYVLVFGGWDNRQSIIGRLGEHDAEVKVTKVRGPSDPPLVEPGRTYHFTVTRKGGRLEWQIDGQPYLSYDDPDPLQGTGHEFFAVNNWESDVYVDNLKIRPAP
jgi:hypothetical protein